MKRVFDDAFKLMAVELSQAKGSVLETARELDIDASKMEERPSVRWWSCFDR